MLLTLLLPMVLPSTHARPPLQDDELPSVDFVLDIARAAVLRCATREQPCVGYVANIMTHRVDEFAGTAYAALSSTRTMNWTTSGRRP